MSSDLINRPFKPLRKGMSVLVRRLFRIPLLWSPVIWLISCNGFPTPSSNWLARIIMAREMILTACSCKGKNCLQAVDHLSSKSILRFCLDIPGTLSKNSLGHRYGALALQPIYPSRDYNITIKPNTCLSCQFEIRGCVSKQRKGQNARLAGLVKIKESVLGLRL